MFEQGDIISITLEDGNPRRAKVLKASTNWHTHETVLTLEEIL